MAIRCFARRNLIGPYRSARCKIRQSRESSLLSQNAFRSLMTSQLAYSQHPQEQRKSSENLPQQKGVRIGEDQGALKGFFSSRWSDLSSTFGNNTAGSSSNISKQSLEQDHLPVPKHPLVQDLMYELQSHESLPNPELVWRLYSAIELTKESNVLLDKDQTSSAPTLLVLPVYVHRRVLRAISPSALGLSGKKSSTLSSSNVQTYLGRVSVIFENLRRQSAGAIPTSADFNKIFSEIVHSGNMTSILTVWSAMTGSSSQVLDHSVSKRAKQRENVKAINAQVNSFNFAEPTRDTYTNLMLGVYRHLQDQLNRALKADLKSYKLGFGLQRRQRLAAMREGELSDSMKRVLLSRSPFEHLSPRAHQALVLASQRTSHLLRDMVERDIPLTKFACNLAMRVMRITGNLTALKALTTLSFGVDLDNLDAGVNDSRKGDHVPTQFSGKPDVHLLNTVIQALGEQSTVGKMVAAYETLTRPLPKAIKARVTMPEGSLFSTDFRNIFNWKDPIEADTMVNSTIEGKSAKQDYATLNITPNTATMIHLVRNACKPPPPQQIAMYISRTKQQQFGQMEEYHARQKGVYANLALYFVRETVSVQEESLKKMANGLGLKENSVLGIIAYFTSQVQKLREESSSGLPRVHHENFLSDYLARLSFLSADDMRKGQAILDNLSRTALIEDNYTMSQKEKLAVQSANRKAEKANAILQASASSFIGDIEKVPDLSFETLKDIPTFTPPGIGVTPNLIRPLITLAKQSRTNGLLHDVQNWLERSIALYICEIRLLNATIESQTISSTSEILQMKEKIDDLHHLIESNAQFYVEHIRKQIVMNSENRRERSKKRKLLKESMRLQAIAKAQEKEKEKQREKLQRESSLKQASKQDANSTLGSSTAENVVQSRQNVVSA